MSSHKLLEKKRQLFASYAQFITDNRVQTIEKVLSNRTRYITVVMEDLYQSHNISAVLRSADCFGIQDVHIIEKSNTFSVTQGIAQGAAQWLTLYRYKNNEGNPTEKCFKDLRASGYSLIATTPHTEDTVVAELPLNKKIALVFGTEQAGLSDYALSHADGYLKVPQYGFTESLNISVCAGIVLYELTKRLRESSFSWRLTEEELIELQLQWLIKTTPFGAQISKELALFSQESL